MENKTTAKARSREGRREEAKHSVLYSVRGFSWRLRDFAALRFRSAKRTHRGMSPMSPRVPMCRLYVRSGETNPSNFTKCITMHQNATTRRVARIRRASLHPAVGGTYVSRDLRIVKSLCI